MQPLNSSSHSISAAGSLQPALGTSAALTHRAMQMGLFLERWRESFWSHVRELESGTLFLKLCLPLAKGKRALFINPRPASYLLDAASPSLPGSDAEEFLSRHEVMKEKLRALGRDMFIELFLGEHALTALELAGMTGLDYQELKLFHDEVLLPAMRDDMAFRRPLRQASCHGEKVALIRCQGEEVQCLFLSDRIRYRIDEERIAELAQEGGLTKEEMQEWRELKKELFRVNERLNLIQQVVRMAVEVQRSCLLTGCIADLVPFEEKEAARLLSIDGSWLCRLIKNKILVTPHGERALHAFFLSRRKARRQKGMRLLGDLIAGPGEHLGDGELRRLMKEYHGLDVPLRTINEWRRAQTR